MKTSQSARRVAIYARVSKAEVKTGTKKNQDPENQLRQLRDWCAQSGHTIVTEYVERESGTKGLKTRKALSELMQGAHRREFDLVLFWSLDRFSREGMSKTIQYLDRLTSAGVAFHSYTEEWLTTDNEFVRDMLLAVLSSLAKQEAIKISERTKAGLQRARAAGKRLGRPATDQAVVEAIIATKAKKPDMSMRALARKFNVSRGVAERALKASPMLKSKG